MLFAGTSAETDATLRAMKDVATAGGTHPLSDRVALVAAHTVVFGGDGELDADALPDITPAPLDSADAADGEYPDWYHPSA